MVFIFYKSIKNRRLNYLSELFFIAVVIDQWPRAVIGWSMSSRMTAERVCDALQMVLWQRKWPINVILQNASISNMQLNGLEFLQVRIGKSSSA